MNVQEVVGKFFESTCSLTEKIQQLKKSLESFLGASLQSVLLPTDAITTDGEIRLFDEGDLQKLVVERPPFLLVEKAVSIGSDYILSTARITPERCAGHFPDRPVVPLIRMCEATAQTGMLLVALNAGESVVPVAVASGESRTLTKTFTEPPVTLLVEGRKVKERPGIMYVVDGKIHANGGEVAILSGIKYLVPPKEYVFPKK